jgi:hypothetical protein
MKVLGRTINSPITLLPLDDFQRHLLAGTSGLLIWVVTSAWNWGDGFKYRDGWNWLGESTMTEGLVYHVQEATDRILFLFNAPGDEWEGQWYAVVQDLLRIVFEIVPTAISLALLVSSCIILLGAFKIVTYPARIRRLAPTVIGVALACIVAVQVIAVPANAFTGLLFPDDRGNPAPQFDVFWWLDNLVRTTTVLAVPIVVLLLSLVPVFAPEKKVSKRTR